LTILDLLAAAAHDDVRLRFLPDHPEPVSGGRLWDDAGRAAGWLAGRSPPGGTVAAILQASPYCVAALVGAWRAGLTVVSLPLRSRMQDAHVYATLIGQLVRSSRAAMLLADPAAAASLPAPGVPVVPYQDCAAGRRPFVGSGTGRFVQFSSGTTARPKGVVLSLSALGANVSALLAVLTHDSPVICSWLPLSHDMGLVGTLLTGWAMGGTRYAGRAEIIMMRPEVFLLSPSEWLRACGEFGATATAAPTFALRTAARRPPAPGTDLSALRILVVGAEAVDAASLRRFAAATSAAGFDPRGICPAYGLAEVGVAATLVPPDQHWRSTTVDVTALAGDSWEPAPAGAEFVGLGTPLPGTEIRIAAGPGRPGEILLRSGSLLDGYLGDGTAGNEDGYPGDGTAGNTDGWLRTGDIGYLGQDDLYVLGRRDDVIIVRGVNLYAASMEAALREALGSARSLTVVPWHAGYAVVTERGPAAAGTGTGPSTGPDLGQLARAALTRSFGMAPNRVVVVPPGTLPRTPSGKIQRSAVRQRLAAGQLPATRDWEYYETR
jgi:acyl-CoA synthetase (AMP-forming)/AMP-acid ligase II